MRHAFPPVAALALAVVLAGCASSRGLAPESQPRDANALEIQRSVGATSDAQFPTQDWWKALGDPQLDALIDEAFTGTPSLAAADARVRQAIAQSGLADAARKPTLGASAQYAGLLIPSTVAMNVWATVTTASPGPTPAAMSAKRTASVPLPSPTQNLVPQYSANSRSNASTSGPPMKAADRIALRAAAINSSSSSRWAVG